MKFLFLSFTLLEAESSILSWIDTTTGTQSVYSLSSVCVYIYIYIYIVLRLLSLPFVNCEYIWSPSEHETIHGGKIN